MLIGRQHLSRKAALCHFVLLIIFLIGCEAAAVTANDQYNQYLLNTEEESGFSGSVLVLRDDSILCAKGFGLADREGRIRNGSDNLRSSGSFRDGSDSGSGTGRYRSRAGSIEPELGTEAPPDDHCLDPVGLQSLR